MPCKHPPTPGRNCHRRHSHIYGAAYSPRARFIPKSTPLADGNQTVLDIPRSADLVNGLFTVTLKGGLYDVDFGPPNKAIRIFVPPNDSSAYTLNDVAAMATNTTLFTVGNSIARKLESTNGVAWKMGIVVGYRIANAEERTKSHFRHIKPMTLSVR